MRFRVLFQQLTILSMTGAELLLNFQSIASFFVILLSHVNAVKPQATKGLYACELHCK
jgi:hypothetical protein